MFQTLEGAELTSPPFRHYEAAGSQSWAYVLQPIDIPWFHVRVGVGSDTRVVFASHVSNWVHLPQEARGDTLRLIDVRLVSPGWLNGTADWMMEPLEEVLEGVDEASGEVGWIFLIGLGRRYVQPAVGSTSGELTRLKRIFRIRPVGPFEARASDTVQ
ncbi:hypothetical protein DFR24_0977 [Panacagrimonas perspica]|uniref:Uncharacterized protein n=1 Tax=Panacagrimonas perspica TaxID=381431 RepID=A0A4S3K530_9GAMM|nr:hypothetical protein [Panacagrimonas perspica]TDU31607.1 hypothetical protein DFR24_0977 [Panacagrimonas perspica]THD03166.1 hypothetical protein B1810_11360 [Panacagrimonas perspica]